MKPFLILLSTFLFLANLQAQEDKSTRLTAEPSHGIQQKVEMLDEFVITAYSGPPHWEVNIERYQELGNTGFLP